MGQKLFFGSKTFFGTKTVFFESKTFFRSKTFFGVKNFFCGQKHFSGQNFFGVRITFIYEQTSSPMATLTYLIALLSHLERKKNKETHVRTYGRTDGVTMSLLELLIAAKNIRIPMKKEFRGPPLADFGWTKAKMGCFPQKGLCYSFGIFFGLLSNKIIRNPMKKIFWRSPPSPPINHILTRNGEIW